MDEPVYNSNSGYFSDAFGEWHILLDNALKHLVDLNFDTIIGTGMSGTLVVPRLAADLDVYWAVIRKPNVDSHSSKRVEGRVGKRWVFVDDFVSSGATYQRVRNAVQDHKYIPPMDQPWDGTMLTLGDHTELVGVYEYQHGGKFTHWGDGNYEYGG
jgi:adenine/guanine phosphoribosyltransferase-like PRPP-binding protein